MRNLHGLSSPPYSEESSLSVSEILIFISSLSHDPSLKQWQHRAQLCSICSQQEGWHWICSASCAVGVCLALSLQFLLHLMMCTDVLGKHPKRKRDSAQYPCSQMTLPYRITFWATSFGML